MAIADGAGLPLAVSVASATLGEIGLGDDVLRSRFLRRLPPLEDRRLLAWLRNFFRLVSRYERHVENFLAFVQFGCIVVLSRRFVG